MTRCWLVCGLGLAVQSGCGGRDESNGGSDTGQNAADGGGSGADAGASGGDGGGSTWAGWGDTWVDTDQALVGFSSSASEGARYTGEALGFVRDLDGDAADEVVIGDPYADGETGRAWLVRSGGAAMGTGDLADADVMLTGDTDAWLGAAVAGLGDLDGDGLGDLGVGLPGVGEGAGAIAVHSGAALATGEQEPDLVLNGEAGEATAWRIVALGDVDDDGVSDVAVGFGEQSPGASAGAWVVSGATLAQSGERNLADVALRISGAESIYYHGGEPASVGDVDGDGLADLLLGSPGDGGGEVGLLLAVDLVGLDSASLSDAALLLAGEAAGDEAGTAVAGPGDLDGDGRPDLVVTAPGANDDDGAVYIISTSTWPPVESWGVLADAGAVILGDDTTVGFGNTAAAAGDLDDDGRGDLMFAAPNDETSGICSGQVWLVLGANAPTAGTHTPSIADFTFSSDTAYSYMGATAAGGGDVNADGVPDLLLAATGSGGTGQAWLFLTP